MILQLATIICVTMLCTNNQIIFLFNHEGITTSIIAWFTQPDILRPMIGGGGEVFQPDMYKPYMTIGICLVVGNAF